MRTFLPFAAHAHLFQQLRCLADDTPGSGHSPQSAFAWAIREIGFPLWPDMGGRSSGIREASEPVVSFANRGRPRRFDVAQDSNDLCVGQRVGKGRHVRFIIWITD